MIGAAEVLAEGPSIAELAEEREEAKRAKVEEKKAAAEAKIAEVAAAQRAEDVEEAEVDVAVAVSAAAAAANAVVMASRGDPATTKAAQTAAAAVKSVQESLEELRTETANFLEEAAALRFGQTLSPRGRNQLTILIGFYGRLSTSKVTAEVRQVLTKRLGGGGEISAPGWLELCASLRAKYDHDPDPRPPSAEHGTPPRGLGQKGARSMSDTGSPAQNSPTQTRRAHKAPRQTTARAAGGTAVADSPIVGSTAPDTRTTEPGAEGAGGADATGL